VVNHQQRAITLADSVLKARSRENLRHHALQSSQRRSAFALLEAARARSPRAKRLDELLPQLFPPQLRVKEAVVTKTLSDGDGALVEPGPRTRKKSAEGRTTPKSHGALNKDEKLRTHPIPTIHHGIARHALNLDGAEDLAEQRRGKIPQKSHATLLEQAYKVVQLRRRALVRVSVLENLQGAILATALGGFSKVWQPSEPLGETARRE
jgi:hypothetical protein